MPFNPAAAAAAAATAPLIDHVDGPPTAMAVSAPPSHDLEAGGNNNDAMMAASSKKYGGQAENDQDDDDAQAPAKPTLPTDSKDATAPMTTTTTTVEDIPDADVAVVMPPPMAPPPIPSPVETPVPTSTDVNKVSTSDNGNNNNNRSGRGWYLAAAAVVILAIVAVVLAVVFTKNKNNNSNNSSGISNVPPPGPAPTPTAAVPSSSASLVPTMAPLPTAVPSVFGPVLSPTPFTERDNPDLTIDQVIIQRGTKRQSELGKILTDTFYYGALNWTNRTFFAPEDVSFYRLKEPYSYYTEKDLSSFWIYHILAVLAYHTVVEPLNSTEIFQRNQLLTNAILFQQLDNFPIILDINITVNAENKTLANGATLISTDNTASNGYIHVPDRVLLMEDLRRTILDWVLANSTFPQALTANIWRELVMFAGVERYLLEISNVGTTFFIPPDDVVQAWDESSGGEALANLKEDKDLASLYILYHVASFVATPDIIILFGGGVTTPMQNNYSAWFTATDAGQVFVNDAQVTHSFLASNGFVSFVDRVIDPQFVGGMLNITARVSSPWPLSTFVALIHDPGLIDDVFNSDLITVFAPIDSAFFAVSTELWYQNPKSWSLHVRSILLHHVTADLVSPFDPETLSLGMLSGYNTTLQSQGYDETARQLDFTIEQASYAPAPIINSLLALNGLIYGVEGVLLPPWTQSTIYQTLQDLNLTKYISLFDKANLTSLVNGTQDGPFTFLVPDNNVPSIQNTTNVTLVKQFLLNHLFEGNFYLPAATRVWVSMGGQSYNVTSTASFYAVGGSTVNQPNILAANGVIHIVAE